MIKNLIAGRWLRVDGCNTSYIPYFNMQSPNPAIGQVRYNGNNQNLEVFDGNTWHVLSSNSSSVTLSNDAEEVLVWGQKKMREEQELEALMKRHPGLKDLHEKFELMRALCQSEEQNSNARQPNI